MPDPARPRTLAPRWLVPIIVVVVGLAVAGGITGRTLYRRPAEPAAPVILPSATPTRGPQPGPATVTLTQGAAEHPLHRAVRKVVQVYFDAINAKNYDYWSSVVTRARLGQKSRAEWERAYRSTTDGSIVIYRIESAGGQALRVLLTFTSTQRVADAPPDFPYRCIRWRAVFPLARQDGRWKLDAGITGATPQHSRC